MALLFLASMTGVVAASNFLSPAHVAVSDAEAMLLSELTGNASTARLDQWEAVLRPTYSSLPKGPDGLLEHQAVRYVLHRLFVKQHGWFIRGLEPSDEAPPPYLQGEWVPSYLQGLLEQRLGRDGGRTGGLNLRELAALAATLEDLTNREAAGRLEEAYQVLRIPTSEHLDSRQVEDVLVTYMMMYLTGHNTKNFTAMSPEAVREYKTKFVKRYAGWRDVESWMEKMIEHNHLLLLDETGTALDTSFEAMTHIVVEIGEHFGEFNEGECQSLKATLVEMEDRMPGRVILKDFYTKSLHSHWNFNEKIEYLRRLGALDETDPEQLRVIVPNYVGSRPNCLEASGLYAVCCRNECDDLMGQLEAQLGAPSASPERIIELVVALPIMSSQSGGGSVRVAGKPTLSLSSSLAERLSEIARANGGDVPIHGRLFAQWMHHVYPRECPYPHKETASPLSPSEWMEESGYSAAHSSEEELRLHVGDTSATATGAAAAADNDDVVWWSGGVLAGTTEELPWSASSEERLVFESSPRPRRRSAPWVRIAMALLLLVAAGVCELCGRHFPALGLAVSTAFAAGLLDATTFFGTFFGSAALLALKVAADRRPPAKGQSLSGFYIEGSSWKGEKCNV